MQPKTIRSILRRKLDDWLSHVDDSAVKDAIAKDAICTGGAIPSLLQGEKPNDFDFYFRTFNTAKIVAEYYVDKFKKNPPSRFKGSNKLVDIRVESGSDRIKIVVKSQGIAGESGVDNYQYFEMVSDPSEPAEFVEAILQDKQDADAKTDTTTGAKLPKYRPVFITSNAITLSDKIQIITRFYGNVNQIHDSYDFVHCTCSWDAATGELLLPNDALISLINKRLKYKHSKYPLCSIIRTRKFLKLGWHIDAGQYVKMAWDLNQLNLSDINVLEDQMVGVDSAYFAEVLDLLKKKTEEGKSIDSTYLMEIIDRVFG